MVDYSRFDNIVCTDSENSDDEEEKILKSSSLGPHNISATPQKFCAQCSKLLTPPIMSCSRCKDVSYCGRKCQKANWKSHKKRCKQICDKKKNVGISEKEMRAMEDAHGTNANTLNNLFELVENLVPGIANGLKYNVHPYHNEFKRRFPNLDPKFFHFCREANTFSSSLKMLDHSLESGSIGKSNEAEVLNRYGDVSEDCIEWLQSSAIVREKFPTVGAFTFSTQSYSTSSRCKTIWHDGDTNVEIGFVDLGQCLLADIFEERNQSEKDNTWRNYRVGNPSCPVRYVGYEICPFAVAKSKVIHEMCLSRNPPSSILQVWFSTGWSEQTFNDFKTAVAKVVLKNQDGGKVLKLLQHWAKCTTQPIAHSRDMWLNSSSPRNPKWSLVCSLREEHDRADLSHYLVTGELLEADMASVCYVKQPKWLSERSRDECFFEGFCVLPILQLVRGEPFLPSIVKFLTDRIVEMIERVCLGTLLIEIHHAKVSLTDQDLLARIASLNPATISWSNLPDHMEPEEFHALAKSCSSLDTCHFAYILNWVRRVKGADVMDIQEEHLKEMVGRWKFFERTFVNQIYNTGTDRIATPLFGLLRSKLNASLIEGTYPEWIDFYFNKQRFDSTVYDIFPLTWEAMVFGRACSMINVTFTYRADAEEYVQKKENAPVDKDTEELGALVDRLLKDGCEDGDNELESMISAMLQKGMGLPSDLQHKLH